MEPSSHTVFDKIKEAENFGRKGSISQSTHLSILSSLLNDTTSSPSLHIIEYLNELHLMQPGLSITQDALPWDVKQLHLKKLELPVPRPHSGQFEWIGEDIDAIPSYLWDRETGATVSATVDILQQGYIAVSWTWGRFQQDDIKGQKQTRRSRGTPWDVPYIPVEGSRKDLVAHLKDCLRSITSYRYFWVDILCINQIEESEKKREIAKQAKIFGAAAGVISYLWRLDQPQILIDSVQGLGHLLSWVLDFGDGFSYRGHFMKGHSSPYIRQFDALRDDSWFTSLWALQEIVLAPAGVWVTRDGTFCKLNGEVVTTRLMAMIIRLLSWAEKKRAELWGRANRSFRKAENLTSKQFEEMKNQYTSKEDETITELSIEYHDRLASYQSRDSSPSRLSLRKSISSIASASFQHWGRLSQNNMDDSGFQGFVLNIVPPEDDPPWVFSRYEEESILREEIQKWKEWAFGQACIDVSLSATRAAILVAGTNRAIVQGNSREEALFAALKVKPDPEFLTPPGPENMSGDNFSTLLLNLILKYDGSKMFDVAHRTPRRSTTRSDYNDFDESEWDDVKNSKVDYLVVETSKSWSEVKRKSDQPKAIQYNCGRSRSYIAQNSRQSASLLTDMFPDTASRMSPHVLHFTSEEAYSWADSTTWHIHRHSALHIPNGAFVQRIGQRKSSVRIWLRPNGKDDDDSHPISCKKDLDKLRRTQPWLTNLLCGRDAPSYLPHFLFLPLSIRNGSQSIQMHRDDLETPCSRTDPDIIGVVLVTGARNKKEPMATWHKYGTYIAVGMKPKDLKWNNKTIFSRLDWNYGILVSAYQNKIANSQPWGSDVQMQCVEQKSKTNIIAQRLSRRLTDEPEFDMIYHREIRRSRAQPRCPRSLLKFN